MALVVFLVDLRGIEPLTPSCHEGVLPVYHRPKWTVGESDSRPRNANAMHYHCANGPDVHYTKL